MLRSYIFISFNETLYISTRYISTIYQYYISVLDGKKVDQTAFKPTVGHRVAMN